jgi:hypothetical protein
MYRHAELSSTCSVTEPAGIEAETAVRQVHGKEAKNKKSKSVKVIYI